LVFCAVFSQRWQLCVPLEGSPAEAGNSIVTDEGAQSHGAPMVARVDSEPLPPVTVAEAAARSGVRSRLMTTMNADQKLRLLRIPALHKLHVAAGRTWRLIFRMHFYVGATPGACGSARWQSAATAR